MQTAGRSKHSTGDSSDSLAKIINKNPHPLDFLFFLIFRVTNRFYLSKFSSMSSALEPISLISISMEKQALGLLWSL